MKNRKIIIPLFSILLCIVIAVIVVGKISKSREVSTNIKKGDNKESISKEALPEDMIINDEDSDVMIVNTSEIIEQPKNNQIEKNNNDGINYFIRVNYQANVVTIYTKDENGNFTVPYKSMVCSCGSATPHGGTYTIPGKKWDRWVWGQMVGNVWAQYYTRIQGSILFHSVPYTSQDKSTLEYWEYDKLGTTASAGCVRLTCEDAKWIYDNCTAGTQVEFYADSNPGPLGKPPAQKISLDEEVRGWDPTDPSSNNPWKYYTREENNNEVISSDNKKNEEIKTDPIKTEIVDEKSIKNEEKKEEKKEESSIDQSNSDFSKDSSTSDTKKDSSTTNSTQEPSNSNNNKEELTKKETADSENTEI